MKDNNNQSEFVKKTVIASAMLLVLLILISILGVFTWPDRTLNRIERHIKRQKYDSAEELIEEYENQVEGADLENYKDICSYNIAVEALLDGNTEDARYRLESLGDYNDATDLLKECDYIDALAMIETGEYEDAYAVLSGLSGYKDADEKMLYVRYIIAENTFNNKDMAKALELFLSLGDYEDAKSKADAAALAVTGADNLDEAYKILEGMNVEQMQKIAAMTEAREALPNDVLAVGAHHTVGLKDDGTVIAVGLNDDGECDTGAWSDIVAVDAGSYHTVALTSEGRVLAVGSNEQGQCDVDSWSNVVEIAAGAYNTYGLLADGTVVSTGFSNIDTINEFKDIKKIGAGSYAMACIDKDGVVHSTHQSLYIIETGAIDIGVSTGYIAALMPDGTVLTSIEQIADWEDIIAISASSTMILGIKSDGSIESCFFSERDKEELEGYTDVVAVAAGGAHSAFLLSDGSVVAFGENGDEQCETQGWELIRNDKQE